jgi:predicted kinase
VVVLAGPGASGKSTWAAANFPADTIVSSDRLRAVVGAGEDDIAASDDAFTLLGDIVARRVGRGLTTVIDTLGLDAVRRRGWLELARAHGLSCVAVAFDTPADDCRARNRGRTKRIPADVLAPTVSEESVRPGKHTGGWVESQEIHRSGQAGPGSGGFGA